MDKANRQYIFPILHPKEPSGQPSVCSTLGVDADADAVAAGIKAPHKLNQIQATNEMSRGCVVDFADRSCDDHQNGHSVGKIIIWMQI